MNSLGDHGSLSARWTAERTSRTGQELQRSSGPVGALLFDLCNVLFDETIWSRRLFQLVSRMGHQGTYEDFWDTWQREFQPRVARGACDAGAALEAFLRACGLKRGQIDEALAAMQTRYRQLGHAVRPLPGVPSGLAQLHAAGLKMGVLGHVGWSTDEVRRRVAQLGVSASIDATLSLRDLACDCPDESPYLVAVRALRAAPEQTVFVSANPYHLAEAACCGLLTASVQLSAVVGQRWAIEQISDLVRLLAPSAVQQSRAG